MCPGCSWLNWRSDEASKSALRESASIYVLRIAFLTALSDDSWKLGVPAMDCESTPFIFILMIFLVLLWLPPNDPPEYCSILLVVLLDYELDVSELLPELELIEELLSSEELGSCLLSQSIWIYCRTIKWGAGTKSCCWSLWQPYMFEVSDTFIY